MHEPPGFVHMQPLMQLWMLQLPLPGQLTVQLPPSQDSDSEPFPWLTAVQPPIGHSRLQLPLPLQEKEQPVPSQVRVHAPFSTQGSQAVPLEQLLSVARLPQLASAAAAEKARARIMERMRASYAIVRPASHNWPDAPRL